MRYFIAQIPQPNGAQVLIWIGCAGSVLGGLAFLVMLFNQLAKARNTIAGKRESVDLHPQPLEFHEGMTPASEKDCRARHDLAMKRIDDLQSRREGDVASLHEKINGVAREVSGLKTAVDSMADRIGTVEALPDRIIAMLRNFGVIGRGNTDGKH